MVHIPVLKKEVLRYLNPKPNENFIDATFGEGGHSKDILERNKPNGKVLGIEADNALYKKIKEKILKGNKSDFSERLILVNGSYADISQIAQNNGFEKVQGILFDLGMSSWQIEESGKGFSFLKDEPLIMKYSFLGNKNELTAKDIVNSFSEKELEDIFRQYGEERFSKRIARQIIKERKLYEIKTTFQLSEIIKKSVPGWYRKRRIHPATKVFQALRIFLNKELDNLKIALPQTINLLDKGGRMVIISFHSLEDKIVKNFLKVASKNNLLKILTKKPIKADFEEIKNNPRSRSAKIRAAMKI